MRNQLGTGLSRLHMNEYHARDTCRKIISAFRTVRPFCNTVKAEHAHKEKSGMSVRLTNREKSIMFSRCCIVLVSLCLLFFHTTAHGRGGNMTLAITSSVFTPDQLIPARYTCEGEDISPPLTFSGVPADTKSLVLIVDDPDAPDPAAPKMIWVHWLIYNLSPDTSGLAEGATAFPAGALQGISDFKRTRYGGPCPPIGRHRYFFKLYALDTMLPDLGRPNKESLLQAMQGHIIEQARLIGLYQKQK